MAVLAFAALLLLAMAGQSSANWCVCKEGLGDAVWQKTLDYACGAGADCNPIHSNGGCYNPNTVKAHCNYAVNSYFQKKGQAQGSCDFAGTANPVTSDPSVTGCVYPSSASTAGTTTTPVTNTPGTPSTGTGTGTPSTGTGTGTGTTTPTTSTTPTTGTTTPTTTNPHTATLGHCGHYHSSNKYSRNAIHRHPNSIHLHRNSILRHWHWNPIHRPRHGYHNSNVLHHSHNWYYNADIHRLRLDALVGLGKKLEGVGWGRGGTEMMLDFNVQVLCM